ncbi:universal stress protein [Actinoallomurus sp. CA-150999]|uniref:universal stress protein n=1 Tax=Actinoallomurus sp. CA-150999 TaxID=3239887 RepID=UPI003D8D0EA9
MLVVPGPRYVITGFDGSPNSVAALRRAAEEARRRHARLDVVQVVPASEGLWRWGRAWLRLRDEVARLLPRSQQVTTRLRVARGEPGVELTRLAARAEALVVGARLNSHNGDPFGGDTVPTVLIASPCEVIVCEGDSRHDA